VTIAVPDLIIQWMIEVGRERKEEKMFGIFWSDAGKIGDFKYAKFVVWW
jgi:hypothetical protein